MIREIVGALFVMMGMFVVAVALVGMFRFRYVMNRMHCSAIADTLGVLLVMIGLAFLGMDIFHALKLGLVVVFLWLTSPVATQVIAKVEILTNEHFEERVGGK